MQMPDTLGRAPRGKTGGSTPPHTDRANEAVFAVKSVQLIRRRVWSEIAAMHDQIAGNSERSATRSAGDGGHPAPKTAEGAERGAPPISAP